MHAFCGKRPAVAVTGRPSDFSGRRVSGKLKHAVAWPDDRQSYLLPKGYFLEYARREHLRALRYNSHLSILVLSLDPATESTPLDLYELSKTLRILVREIDVLGWYAKNAIAILLAESDRHGTEECIRRIRHQLRHIPLTIETRNFPDLESNSPPEPDQVSSYPFIPIVSDTPRASRSAIALKRALDIFGSITGILLFSPVMLVVAIAIKATSPGPVIYKQVRVGQGGAPFVFFKFRSMRANAAEDSHRNYVRSLIKGDSSAVNQGDAQKPFYKMTGDSRITPVGRFIRKSSIDELPQFFNVLRGDMSLVGPRPPIPYEVQVYKAWHFRRILDVKPGITGLWQVEGRSRYRLRRHGSP